MSRTGGRFMNLRACRVGAAVVGQRVRVASWVTLSPPRPCGRCRSCRGCEPSASRTARRASPRSLAALMFPGRARTGRRTGRRGGCGLCGDRAAEYSGMMPVINSTRSVLAAMYASVGTSRSRRSLRPRGRRRPTRSPWFAAEALGVAVETDCGADFHDAILAASGVVRASRRLITRLGNAWRIAR